MKILVTGAAGFIGYSLCKHLLKGNNKVFGLDNFNNYYDKKLKYNRYKDLKKVNSSFKIYKINLENINKVNFIFQKHKFDYVYHFAAQAGVRYSINDPDLYFKTNIFGFYNVLKCCEKFKVKHLIFASSSSVYGDKLSKSSESDNTDHPLQFYAATKKSNEVMAHSFSNIYKLPTTAVRFFTIYGPWGRPDMSLFKFTNSILNKKIVYLYNSGNHKRDFTYIDDIVVPLKKLMKKQLKNEIPFQIFNLGNGESVSLKKFLNELKKTLKLKPKIKYLNKQKGDVKNTLSDNLKSKKKLNFKSSTNYKKGIKKFVKWYLNYYKIYD